MSSVSQHPIDDRAERACEDVVAVESIAPGMANVVTFGGSYVVDARDGGCLCPDAEYSDVALCKHQLAAILADRDDLPKPFITTERGGL